MYDNSEPIDKRLILQEEYKNLINSVDDESSYTAQCIWNAIMPSFIDLMTSIPPGLLGALLTDQAVKKIADVPVPVRVVIFTLIFISSTFGKFSLMMCFNKELIKSFPSDVKKQILSFYHSPCSKLKNLAIIVIPSFCLIGLGSTMWGLLTSIAYSKSADLLTNEYKLPLPGKILDNAILHYASFFITIFSNMLAYTTVYKSLCANCVMYCYGEYDKNVQQIEKMRQYLQNLHKTNEQDVHENVIAKITSDGKIDLNKLGEYYGGNGNGFDDFEAKSPSATFNIIATIIAYSAFIISFLGLMNLYQLAGPALEEYDKLFGTNNKFPPPLLGGFALISMLAVLYFVIPGNIKNIIFTSAGYSSDNSQLNCCKKTMIAIMLCLTSLPNIEQAVLAKEHIFFLIISGLTYLFFESGPMIMVFNSLKKVEGFDKTADHFNSELLSLERKKIPKKNEASRLVEFLRGLGFFSNENFHCSTVNNNIGDDNMDNNLM